LDFGLRPGGIAHLSYCFALSFFIKLISRFQDRLKLAEPSGNALLYIPGKRSLKIIVEPEKIIEDTKQKVMAIINQIPNTLAKS
jgi:hypothetical protein